MKSLLSEWRLGSTLLTVAARKVSENIYSRSVQLCRSCTRCYCQQSGPLLSLSLTNVRYTSQSPHASSRSRMHYGQRHDLPRNDVRWLARISTPVTRNALSQINSGPSFHHFGALSTQPHRQTLSLHVASGGPVSMCFAQ